MMKMKAKMMMMMAITLILQLTKLRHSEMKRFVDSHLLFLYKW